MSSSPIKLAIVGVGKIVRDQHLPSLATNSSFSLVATASRNASIDGVKSYKDIESMLAQADVDAVALCMPPQYRYAAARLALEKGKHVLLEKPPGSTVSEVDQLLELAADQGVTLYATWHSRHGAAVSSTKSLLSPLALLSAKLTWKESVKKWHPGQDWIWQAGGLGVFDPGINGLSILTECLNEPAYVTQAELSFPENKAAPIAARMVLKTVSGIDIDAEFDWRYEDGESWDIQFVTNEGVFNIKGGGASLEQDGDPIGVPEYSKYGEYQAIYQHFATLIKNRQSDVDLRPLKLVADAFLLGVRRITEPFHE